MSEMTTEERTAIRNVRMERRAARYRAVALELPRFAERQEARCAGMAYAYQAARVAAPMAAAIALAYEAGDWDAGQAAEALLEAFLSEDNNRTALSAPLGSRI